MNEEHDIDRDYGHYYEPYTNDDRLIGYSIALVLLFLSFWLLR